MREIKTRSNINTVLSLPGSKSVTHRALIVAALAEGRSQIKGALVSEDTDYTLQALQNIGVSISGEGANLEVLGTGGQFSSGLPRHRIFLGNSGTSMRLLLSVIALCHGEYLLDGNRRMRQRPIGQLVTALNQLGSEAMCLEKAGCPPVLVKAKGIRGGNVTIPGDKSSQYLSSLLLAGPYSETDVEIEVTGHLVSNPYVEITLDVMSEFGVEVFRDGYKLFRLKAGQGYQCRKYVVEADISNASYFWAGAAITGGTVTTDNINPFSTHQGDIGFLNLMEEMGCLVEREVGRVTVQGRPLSGISVDMSSMPDMVPTLAAVALFAEGKTVIRNVPHLRDKESDRLGAVRMEWERLGGRVEELPDGLVINGGNPLGGTVVNPHDDHRLAMSLAVVGLRVRGVCVENEDCVNKSFPLFWKLWDYL